MRLDLPLPVPPMTPMVWALYLALFLVEGADDAHAGQVFAGEAQNPVEAGLHRLIQRPGDDHDAEDHDAQ